ncbi:MAG: SH3 domain-containing protein [Chloroflexi bacterium]|nr:SH3 domain-containing protein [Chloroflexota bacterium]
MKKLLYALALFALTLSACNIPVAQEPGGLSVGDQAATLVAQTLTAVAQENQVPLASPTAGENLIPQATPTLAPNSTPTAGNIAVTLTAGTPNATILTVDANTNCREGPGTSYTIVIQLVPGTQYQMIGRTADNKYWIVTEIGKATQCWVPAEFSNAFGNVNLLAVVTPSAATSAAGTLLAPTNLAYEFECVFNGVSSDITVKLGWTDRSNNEDGFRIYRDGTLVGQAAQNATFYSEVFAGGASIVYSYYVAAFNAQGEAFGGTISFSCQ